MSSVVVVDANTADWTFSDNVLFAGDVTGLQIEGNAPEGVTWDGSRTIRVSYGANLHPGQEWEVVNAEGIDITFDPPGSLPDSAGLVT